MDEYSYLSEGTKKTDLRMVLVGRIGVGKSAAGNTILGQKAFESRVSSSNVTSMCQMETTEFNGQKLFVVDTPGLYDTKSDAKKEKEESLKREITRCILMSAPGPHMILIVIHLGRFSEEENTLELIQRFFGKQAADHTMVLFTHGDELEEEGVHVKKIVEENAALYALVRQCGGRYHVFNNKKQDPSQVRALLKKLNDMVWNNGGNFYTNEMLQKAERDIKEEMERLLKENGNMSPIDARGLAVKGLMVLGTVVLVGYVVMPKICKIQ